MRNTLELSRIRAGALEVEPERVDIADLVQHAVRRLRPIARAHRVRLDVDDDLPPVSLDVTMAEQILLNLLENALRFAPPGSEIVVGAHAPAGDDEIELRVADHGPGVPPEARGRIFEEFQSAETRPDRTRNRARSRHRAGARRRARRFGALRGHARRRRHVRVYVSAGGPGRVTTILLVEDDPALRRALRTMMRSRDLEVLDVATGEEAVVVASSGTPDLMRARPRTPRHRRARGVAPRARVLRRCPSSC